MTNLHIDNIVESNLEYLEEWAKDTADYFLIKHDTDIAIIYMSPERLWTFLIYNTIADMSIIIANVKVRKYQVLFSLTEFENCSKCNVEQYVIGQFTEFKHYAYV